MLAYVRELLVTYFIRNKQMDETVKVIASMAAKVDEIQHLLDHNTERMAADIPKSNEIDKVILEARASLKASRAYLLQFHNGSNFSTSTPVWKFSLTHESTDTATRSIANATRDILVSNVLPFITPLFDPSGIEDGIERVYGSGTSGNFNVFKLTTAALAHSTIKGLMLSQGVSELYYAPVLDAANRPVGIICIDYTNSEPPSFADDEYMFRKLLTFSSIISAHIVHSQSSQNNA